MSDTGRGKEEKNTLTFPVLPSQYQENVVAFMEDFPAREIWRFFIDGVKQKEDKRYHETITNINAEIDSEVKPVSTDAVKALHKLPIKMILDSEQDYAPSSLKRLLQRAAKSKHFNLQSPMPLGEFLVEPQNGVVAFEHQENGYLLALIATLRYACTRSQVPDITTVPAIVEVHKRSIHNVGNITNEEKTEIRKTNGIGYRLGKNTATEEGILNILQKMWEGNEFLTLGCTIGKQEAKINRASLKSADDGQPNFLQRKAKEIMSMINGGKASVALVSVVSGNVQESIQQELEKYAQQFKKDLAAASDDREKKLISIVKYVQDCDQLHPFNDANCRTFCMISLNRLLIENGFLPVMQENPNRFDGWSPEQLARQLSKEMDATYQLVTTQAKTVPNAITTDEIIRGLPASLQEYFTGCITQSEKMFRGLQSSSSVKDVLVSFASSSGSTTSALVSASTASTVSSTQSGQQSSASLHSGKSAVSEVPAVLPSDASPSTKGSSSSDDENTFKLK